MASNTQWSETVDLGRSGWRAPVHSHLAYTWETERDFTDAIGFVEAGLQGPDHCVVIGQKPDNERTLAGLAHKGIDVIDVQRQRRLTVVERDPTARQMLNRIAAIFGAALMGGAPVLRLFGNVGWGRHTGPPDGELLSYELELTGIAESFPSVILCLHQASTLSGPILRHGVLTTHPQLLDQSGVLGNPHFVPIERSLLRAGRVTSRLSHRQSKSEALRRETEILQGVFDKIPTLASLRDSSGQLLLVNREWERSLGWTLEEAQRVDMTAEACPDPAARQEVLELIARIAARATSGDADGTEAAWPRVERPNGHEGGRRSGDAALRESQDRFRAVFDSAPDAIVIVDDDSRFTEVNPAACALFGRAPEDFLGHPVAEITSLGFEAKEMWKTLRREGQLHGEWRLTRPDGSSRHVEFMAKTDFLPGHHLSVIRDITQRKRLENELRTTQAHLMEGQTLTNTGSWAWNAVTTEAVWSKETFRIFGVAPETTQASIPLFLSLLHPEDRPGIKKEFERSIREKDLFDSHYRIVRPDGSIRYAHSRGRPIVDDSGELVQLVGAVTDVTEYRLAEEVLRQSHDELQALSERLCTVREEEGARIAREVHDEVGQTLTALQMDVAWLENRLATSRIHTEEPLAPKLRSMAALLEKTVDAVQRIATELRPGVLDELGLEDAIGWYVREFERRTGIAGRIRFDIKEVSIAPHIATAVFRILQEALTNVGRHSGANETRVELVADEGQLSLEITDNGRGVPPDRIANSGSFGLLGMRERARALGGGLVIRGAQGRGTSVTLTVPL